METGGALGVCSGQRVLVLSPTPTHPQDYGNRKRIFRICSRFSAEGAHITFVHYPAEQEWRNVLPVAADRAMRQCWDQYHIVSPTRPLHTDPLQMDHEIDEWFDPAIGQFLSWLFSVQSFEIFVVNYSWLSKAFEFAPPQTFKILDTHDKVSGRRDMLASLGLGPEFFYTTEQQEAIALRRADLVWAIKDQERALFERMAPTPVLTMPHLDPCHVIERPAPDPDGLLRIGIIGARNNVNRINITEFLGVALPIFEAAFAPVRIVIAGTVCELLDGVDDPLIELRGEIESVEDFYRTVDCAVVPMRASTGLKIKAGEAISLGLPLLALAHAFEGYEAADALHTLDDFGAMAKALVELSFAPRDVLDALAAASMNSHRETGAKIEESFRETVARVRKAAPSIVLAVDSRAFAKGSIFNLVLNSVHEYLRDLGQVTVLVVRGAAGDIVDHPQAVDAFDRVLLARDVAGAEAMQMALSQLSVDVVDLEAWLQIARPKMLIVDALHPALQKTVLPDSIVILRTEMIAYSLGAAAKKLPGRGFKRAYASAPGPSPLPAGLAASAGTGTLLLPAFRRSPPVRVRAATTVRGRKTLALLGRPGSQNMAMAALMAKAWGLEPFVVCGLEDDAGNSDSAIPVIRADMFLADLYRYRAPCPHFAVDLSAGRPGLMLCREALERLRVPLVSSSAIGLHPSLRGDAAPLKAGSEAELWAAIRGFALQTDAERLQSYRLAWNDLELGRGWAWIWRNGKKLFEASRAAER